jgi:hypothetical protein
MTRRILLAGAIGGLVMFVWTSLAHMVLPLGEAGVREIPNDRELLDAMHAKLGDASGLYLFPGFGLPADATRAQKNAAMSDYGQKLAAHPSGMLVYHPPGAKELTAGQLITELATEIVEALLMAWLMAQTRLASYLSRVGFAVVCGLLAAGATNLSYWNWYGFPASYTLAYIATQVVGMAAAGLVAARLIRPVAAPTAACATV